MEKISDLRLSKNMKYTALYIAMRYFEESKDMFYKRYNDGTEIIIDSCNQNVLINKQIAFILDTHESFVKLECINRILSLGYKLEDFKLEGISNELYFQGYHVKFIVWDDYFPNDSIDEKHVIYKSRLVSGVLEYKTLIQDSERYDYGLFEMNGDISLKKKINNNYHDEDFIIEENRIMKYNGSSKIVVVPEGIEELESSSFWDNQFIEEVILPKSLRNMGGDTFYNCKNLRKINIPENVILMGNNPFAGCPLVEISNYSKAFYYENGVLYSADKGLLIYCSIKGNEKEFTVPEGVQIIGKHAFFLCDRFEKISLPTTLRRMENNPFSGCSKLELNNKSNEYYIKDDIIYNKYRTSVVGALNKIKTKRLELLDGIETINRNSFWNCTGIEEIVFPKSLRDIGYNPFVGCCNIHFESNSPFFSVKDGILYNKDCSKIICYPAWKAKGNVNIPDSVITLERGAFSGCQDMTSIKLHNVNIINKSCFTNCTSLKEIYCSDLITYIGEWAFAYCRSLKHISVNNNTFIDNNAFSNCPAIIEKRHIFSNYLFESENLFTLKSMVKAYKGKIDSILIDPPYNSNIDYIGYKDSNYENGYVNFMRERIEIAYDLLSDHGFLVINIDEGELNTLVSLCESFFGKQLVSIHKWKKLHPFFDQNRDVKPLKKVVLYEYIIICRKTTKSVFNTIRQPYIDQNTIKEVDSSIPDIFDCFGTTSSAKDEIKMIFGRRDYFSTPKPVKLIKELIRATTSQSSIVLDFFAGSGTMAHALVELNAEDGGERVFILVSNNESNICKNVTLRRLQILNTNFAFMD